MKHNNYTLGTKIHVGEGLAVGFLAILGVFAIYTVTTLQYRLERVVKVGARNIELASEINQAVTMIQNAQRGLLLGSMINDASMVRSATQNLADSGKRIEESLKESESQTEAATERQLLGTLKMMESELVQKSPVFEGHVRGQQFDVASKMQTDYFTPHLDRMQRTSSELVQLSHETMATDAQRSAGQVAIARVVMILLCLLSALVAAAAFFVTHKGIVQLRQIAHEIAEGSGQVASASQQVSSASQSLAQGSSEQAASLQETSASAEEIHSMTKRNTDNTRNASDETGKADVLLKETGQKLKEMIGSMTEINSSSEKIGKIIRVIDEIAFQTNILALNAAVEAARAGEAGMGFAVVADEVRNLSQRCAQAAKDTSDLIEESIERSNEGKHRLDEVAACIGRVFENSARIKLLASEVHLGSQEQSRGIEQISRAVVQMQQLTQSTAASAEQGAAAGEQMSAQAQSLQDSVGRLRDLVGGDGSERGSLERIAGATAQSALRPAARVVKSNPPLRSRTPFAGGAGSSRSSMALSRPAPAQSDFPMDDEFKDF